MIKLLTFIFGPLTGAILEIKDEVKGLEETPSLKAAIGDFFHVARNTGFVLFPTILSSLIFLILPQGRDTLLLVVEKMDAGDFRQLVFFLLAIIIWSMASELSIRYAIAISDNSGRSLRESRVYWRKICQRILASFGLFWPSVMIIISLIWCYRSASYMNTGVKLEYFGIFIACLLLILRLLSQAYFYRHTPRIGDIPAKTYLGARSLPTSEYNWVNRLYGIYNEFVFNVLKPSNFHKDYKKAMKAFTDYISEGTPEFRIKFLQNNNVMVDRRVVPAEFVVINESQIKTGRGDSYKWRYRIPSKYFKVFHIQVGIMAGVALLLMVTFSLIPASCGFFGLFGAPALICVAFASYSGIYSGLLFLDFGLLRRNPLPLRWLLFGWLLYVSATNRDHPVNMARVPNGPRNSVSAQFDSWFSHYKGQMDKAWPGKKQYPVVFICAEGGAFRTGAYTSIFLTQLQHDLNQRDIDFKQSIFCMSGVSGGSLGLAYYNAKAFGSDSGKSLSGADLEDAKHFFQYDCLSPIVGKMFFGEFLNLFLLNHVKNFDRSIALEESWKSAYQTTLNGSETNRFSENFIDGKRDSLAPLLIINTTEIESGYQCWISSARPDSLLYQPKRDLLQQKVKQVSYSTAVDFSTRFPLFSPGAEIDTTGGRLHYLDGGYVENTGAGSTLEVLSLLEKNSKAFAQVTPIVIYLRFSDNDNTQAKNIHFANELVEIVAGIYNTRVGRSFTAIAQLNHFVGAHHGIIIDEPLSKNDRDVPMNWMLSTQSMNNILGDIAEKMKDTSGRGVKVRLFQQGLKYLPNSIK